MATLQELMNPVSAALGKSKTTSAPQSMPVKMKTTEQVDTIDISDFDDVMTAKFEEVKAKGIPDNDAAFIVRELKNTGRLTAPKPQPMQEPAPQAQEEGGFIKGVEKGVNFLGGGIGNIIGGAVEEAPRVVTSGLAAASRLGGMINPLTTKEEDIRAAESVRNIGESAAETTKKVGAYNPESLGSQVGRIGTQIGATAAIPGGVLGKAGQAMSTAQKIARGAGQGIIESTKFSAVTEGKPVPNLEQAVIGGAIGGAIPAVASGVKAAIPKLQLSGLLNPSKLTQVKERIMDEALSSTDELANTAKEFGKSPERVSRWMLDRNIVGSKDEIIEKLGNNAMKAREDINTALGSVTKRFKDNELIKAAETIAANKAGVPGLESEAKIAMDLVKKAQTKGLTLPEAQQLKQQFDDVFSIYTLAGDVKSGLQKKGLDNLRKGLRAFIEKEADKAGNPNIRLLNNEIAVSKSLAEAIAKKEDAAAARELLSVFAPGTIGGVTGGVGGVGPFDSATTEGRIGNTVFGVLAGAGLGSTKLKTNTAKVLDKLGMPSTLKKVLETRAFPVSKEQIKSLPKLIGK